MINYKQEREVKKEYGIKLGFDYLPNDYIKFDRHKQNNLYMISMWENELDLTHSKLDEAIKQYCEFEELGVDLL